MIKGVDNEKNQIYILGDLKPDSDCNIPTKKIKSLYELRQLSQLIRETIWVILITSIDRIIATTPEKISDSGAIHGGISDHGLIFATRKVCTNKIL